MKIKIIAITAAFIMSGYCSALAGELITSVEKIIPKRSGQIPQAPRVSPDQKSVVFEYYTKEDVALWLADSDGKNSTCLTCDSHKKLENGSWHPSGRYIVYNQVPEGNLKEGGVYTAELKGRKLSNITKVAKGARPQFSSPNGHVIFFETSVSDNNILAYQVLGPNPVAEPEKSDLELRGPIQEVNRNSEVSHPFLAPDGTTIVFAARSTNIQEGGLAMNDIDRQKIYKLWQALLKIPDNMVNKELETFSSYLNYKPELGRANNITSETFRAMLKDEALMKSATIVKGYSKRDFLLLWVTDILDERDPESDLEVQNLIYPRLWMTDVFGAPVEPLVKDLSSTSLPQKWPTVSHDGNFVVFEAGHWKNRHIYMVRKSGGKWSERAIKLTEKGSYNSSPEVSPDGKWLYFESNRDGTKGIWRARLDWKAIDRMK